MKNISKALDLTKQRLEILGAHVAQKHKTKDCTKEHASINQFQNVNVQKRKRRKEDTKRLVSWPD